MQAYINNRVLYAQRDVVVCLCLYIDIFRPRPKGMQKLTQIIKI